MPKWWIGSVSEQDDFGFLIKDEFIDGRTLRGPWAIMTPESWQAYGVGRLGTGYGQRYKKNGENWLKVEG